VQCVAPPQTALRLYAVMKICPFRTQNDIRPFIKTPAEMDIWSTDYFLQLVDMINFIKQ
jgi:hypothetical protein